MNLHNAENEIEQIGDQWHKLLFLYKNEILINQLALLDPKIKVLNLNLLLSESLINLPKGQYSLYIEEIIQNFLYDQSKIYIFQHFEILFDPVLQIHPIRLFENISKRNKLIVIWPGLYENGILNYAEVGHPEYFTCSDYEGKVIVN
ncbi:BREX-3 system P-loop-containing protein BrxF [Priestia sp. TRN 1309]|uniref:BREX-3 system P-loop-containing protein BrxF n=1 Tax=Priestia sp. TRN 1309 TaxID=3420729 RepID=UPI003D77452A